MCKKVQIAVEGSIMSEFQKERRAAIAEMFENESGAGTYPTTRFSVRLDKALDKAVGKALSRAARLEEVTGEKYQELLEAAQKLVRARTRTKYDSKYHEWEYSVGALGHNPMQRLADAAKALATDNPDKAKE